MGAALRAGDGVHLVDDHRLDAAQHLAALRGEQEVERLGRRDQDVRRRAQHLAALALIRVAGAHADRQRRAEPRERAAQVALDVVVERLQRRDVEQPQSLARPRVEPVDPGQERRQRLARAGRRLHEDVRAGRDHGPGGLLRGRRAGERPLEPGARRGREGGECVHPEGIRSQRCPASAGHRAAGLGSGSMAAAATAPIHFTGDPEADAFLGAEPARAADRVRARPAGDGAEGVLVAARALEAARRARRREIAAMDPDELEAVFREKPALHRFPGEHGAARAGALRRDRERVRRRRVAASGRTRATAPTSSSACWRLPGIGEMKVTYARSAVIAKRLGVAPAGGRSSRRTHARLGDVDSPEALADVPGGEARAQGGAPGAADRLTRCRSSCGR